MKKALIIVLSLAVVIGGIAIVAKNRAVPDEVTNSLPTALGQNDGENPVEETQNLPVYQPGSVKLAPEEVFQDWAYFPSYRVIYYAIDGVYTELIPYTYDSPEMKAWSEFFESMRIINGQNVESNEMALVTFVKYFNIPRADFEKAIEKQRQNQIELLGMNESNADVEGFELPNADIIYTFDNDIINEYYRRA